MKGEVCKSDLHAAPSVHSFVSSAKPTFPPSHLGIVCKQPLLSVWRRLSKRVRDGASRKKPSDG